MLLFCRKLVINKPELLRVKGPVLLACNHPNSFLDGVILDALFEQPLYSLARGDVFRKPLYIRLLRALRILPVYRISEGAGNLPINYETFSACQEIFLKKGIVVIFSEGKCINEWHLRPLKKGTARLAVACWKANIPLRVLPVGINYSSFRRFGKNAVISFGEMIEAKELDLTQPDGTLFQHFNMQLADQLGQLVYEIQPEDRQKKQKLLSFLPSAKKRWLLHLPALVGWITHWPLYSPVKKFTVSRTRYNDHYDSVLTAILLFTYPVYLLFISGLLYRLTGSPLSGLLLLLLPFTAWSYVQLKPQLD